MFDDLSEQQLVDCALNHFYQDNEGNWGAFGCDGAWPPGRSWPSRLCLQCSIPSLL